MSTTHSEPGPAPTVADNWIPRRTPLRESLRVWWRNFVHLAWLNQLALWWMRRGLRADPQWYITWHANVSCRLQDLQAWRSNVNWPPQLRTAVQVCVGYGNFDFDDSKQRNAVAHDILKLVFGVDDDLYLRAYGEPVPSYRHPDVDAVRARAGCGTDGSIEVNTATPLNTLGGKS